MNGLERRASPEPAGDRHPTVMLDVVREIDGRHAAAPQLSLDDIAAGEGGVEAVALISLHGSSSKIIDWPRNPPAGPAIRPRYAVQKGPTLRVRPDVDVNDTRPVGRTEVQSLNK